MLENPSPLLTCAFLAQGFVRFGTVVKNARNSNKEVISVEAQARVHLREHHFVVGKKSALCNSLSTISYFKFGKSSGKMVVLVSPAMARESM